MNIGVGKMANNISKDLGRMLKRQRMMVPLTIGELAAKSGVSASHLSRIERGQRYPSASVLQRIAKPLGLDENELFSLAGYLSPRPPGVSERVPAYRGRRLDPHVAAVLAQEPVEVQRVVIGIINILKNIARAVE